MVAAYRDQTKVVTNDARQILGPYAEPGHDDHTAYWHAVTAILNARRLADLELAQTANPDVQAYAQVASDLYLSLPQDERAMIQNAVAERQRELWFGPRTGLDDQAVTHPANSRGLHDVLAERGHFALPRPDRNHEPEPPTPAASTTRPVEVDTAEARQHARQAAERAARMEAARLNNLRSKNRRTHQPQRLQAQRSHSVQAAPVVQPQPQQTQQERQLGL